MSNVDLLQKFEAVSHEWKSFRTRQTHNRDIINFLLTSSSRSVPLVTNPRFSSTIYGPCASVTYGTDLELG